MREHRGARAGALVAALAVAVAATILAWPGSEAPVPAVLPGPSAAPEAPRPPPRLAASPRTRSSGVATPQSEGSTSRARRDEDPLEKPLAAVRADVEARRWARAREGLDALLASNRDADGATRKSLDAVCEEFDRGRKTHLSEIAALRLPEILRASIEARVATPDVSFVDVQAWLRKRCGDAALEALWRELRGVDAVVTREEAVDAWDARVKTDESWRPMPEGLPAALSSDGRVVTRDSWWAGISKEERTSACFAIFVAKSGSFEVERSRYR